MKALIEKRNAKVEEMKALVTKAKTEERALTEEELKAYEALKKAVEELDKTITAAREAENAEEKKPEGEPVPPKEGKEEDEEQRTLDYKEFDTYLRDMAANREMRANVDVQTNGNALIPTTIAKDIIEIVKELSPIYQMATIYNVGGDLVFPVYDEASDTGAAFVEDMTELTETAGRFTTIKLQNYIVGVLKVISRSLINRTDFDLVKFVERKVAENIAQLIEKVGLNGESGKAHGVFETQNLITAAAVNTVTADELIDLQLTVPEAFQNKACWIMHKDTFKAIRKLKDSQGEYLLSKDLTNGFGWVLLGKPVYISENAPKMASEKTAIVYGDMSGLYIKLAQNVEIQVLREKYATKHAIGVVGYVEFDSAIVEAQKIAGLKMKKGN